jgi:hypothetical protein
VVASAAPRVLADSVGPGGTAALVVLVLIVACVGIFFAFIGSLKRLRKNVKLGTFNTESHTATAESTADAEANPAEANETVTPDPKGRAAGGA